MSRSKNNWQFIALLGLIAFLAACSGVGPDNPATSGAIGTGLDVSSEFEAYYEEHGGAIVFGFPITNSFVDSQTGHLVQYFQHLHLEYDAENQTVIARPLGLYYAPPEAEQTPIPFPDNGRQRQFPETDFTVHNEFLAFYEANGDESVFGQPVTAQFDEGGHLVQYFENAKLVWNPNALPEFRVQVASLGSTYLWQYGSPVVRNFGIRNSATILEADVSATVKEPILYAGDEQVIYVSVIAVDSLLKVGDADVAVSISYAGQTFEPIKSRTDQSGHTQIILDLSAVQPGEKVQVQVEAINTIGATIGQSTLSFKTWW